FQQATYDFHETVYRLGGNRVLGLLTKGVTQTVTSHVMARMDPVEMRGAIVEEHEEMAAAISSGQAAKAKRQMREHFGKLYEFYKKQWPARLDELVEWR